MQVPLLDLKEQNDLLRPEIEAALARVLDTNGFILGSEVAALERELAEYCGTKHAIGMCFGQRCYCARVDGSGCRARR
ncbi:MAG: DegT/DnrJ/EryC1/StrS family aminotransferase [Pyrinomonadaceae bacterium]